MTMPVHETKSMAIYNSMQLSSLEDGDILFLDELLEADQFVLSTLLTVIESREMADGTPLPDIQIIAATNDTVPPEQLRPNIRQRFMFKRFSLDISATRSYIHKRTGIEVPADILNQLTDDGTDYNFLTPRSLTKLCMWINSAPDDKLKDVANTIDMVWQSGIGTELMIAKRKSESSPEAQVRNAVRTLAGEEAYEINSFNDCTMAELYEILQRDYPDVLKMLDSLDIKDDKKDVDIKF